MTSALMEVEESSMASDNVRITGLESQILNSQEIIVRLHCELDSALLRITTLETVCSENQNDLHEKRMRIKELDDELIEREEINERLTQELNEKDEKLQNFQELIIQLKEHIKQNKEDEEDRSNPYQELFSEFGDISITDLRSQIQFDRQLRELILVDLDVEKNSPQEILNQFHNSERLKFHNLLQTSLTTEDISDLINSDDILFELLTHLNSLSRLKETLSRDSKQLQHIRSLLHLTNDDNDELINDLINKRECIDFLRSKIDNNHDFTDFELIKYVLHKYFNFQQQQIELKEYLQLNTDHDDELNYSRLLIERCNEAIHDEEELNERIKNQDQIIEQLNNQFNEIVLKFSNPLIDEEMDERTPLDRIRAILQSNNDLQQTLSSVTSNEKHFDQDLQLRIDELTKEMNELKEELNIRKNQLKEITKLDNDDDETQFNLIRSSVDFRHALSNKFSIIDDDESILQRIDNYQLIINTLNPQDKDWTNETTDELVTKLQTMKTAENRLEDLQQRLDESIDQATQLQVNIKQIADQFAPNTDDNEESDITRIYQSLQFLTNFRQEFSDKPDEEIEKSHDKQDVEIQTIDDEEFYLQIKELLGIDEDHPEEIMNKIKELFEISQQKIAEDEKLRNLLNINDENLLESVMKLNENVHQLTDEHDRLVQKENTLDKSIERMMDQIGLFSDSSPTTQIDEICTIIDTFCLTYCQLTATDIETMNLVKIFPHIQAFLIENNRLKKLIDQIESSQDLDYISKLQTYLTKIEDNRNATKKILDFKQQLLTRLSIDHEAQIFDRLNEIEQINTDLKEKLQTHNDSTSTLTSLNTTVLEQRNKILEYEETLEKLRSQRERMLTKMKEMKTNNETLTNEVKQANQSIDDLHRREIDLKNQIEEIEQKLRSANNQLQVTLDDCRTQQDLQETMKLEIESIKNEMEAQRKSHENRYRQIINEKKQLDKNSKEFLEEKQILEEENQRLQTILQTIKDTLEHVDDIHSIVDTILKIRQDYFILKQHHEQIKIENEKLLLNIHQQKNIIDEYIQTKTELEKRLINNEQELINSKKEIEENINRYEHLHNEFQLYKENHQMKTNPQVAVINIEQSSPPLQPHLLAVQQAAESNNWMAIDMKDDEIPLTMTNKYPVIDTPTAIFNLLGELKSKLGITLTHRPRSSSAFFLYLCAVHLLTLYLLFLRRC